MSAYTMLAEQSSYGAPAFTTADAVTTNSSFDDNNALSGDFMGFGLTGDEEPVWNMSPISPSFANWNPNIDASFVPAAALDRDFKQHTQVRNGQLTPPLDDQRPSLSSSGDHIMTVFDHHNSWDDTPTPPSSGSHTRNNSTDYTSKKRRLREHKNSVASAATTFSSGADSEDQGPEQVKREKFLERNRLAASKCRQKKKEHTMLLETQFKEQSDRKTALNNEISQLRGEILTLKNEVLRHAQCGDEPIKLHLAQMVKQISHKDRSDPAEGGDEHIPEQTSPRVPQGSVSFGFEESLPLDSATSLAHQIRRDSEASMAISGDEFDDLINC